MNMAVRLNKMTLFISDLAKNICCIIAVSGSIVNTNTIGRFKLFTYNILAETIPF